MFTTLCRIKLKDLFRSTAIMLWYLGILDSDIELFAYAVHMFDVEYTVAY